MAVNSALKEKITGWGADLDPANRPGVPRERKPPLGTGAHWSEPERQIPKTKILVSSEHRGLTPVFGTACPLKGLSGIIREFAFRFSEGRKSHWLFLLVADRVDELESGFSSLFRGRAHNPFYEMGLKSEFKDRAFLDRFDRNRSDSRRWAKEFILVSFIPAIASYLMMSRRKLPRR